MSQFGWEYVGIFGWWFSLTPEAQASWAQALGSFVAIAVAYCIGAYQSSRYDRLQRFGLLAQLHEQAFGLSQGLRSAALHLSAILEAQSSERVWQQMFRLSLVKLSVLGNQTDKIHMVGSKRVRHFANLQSHLIVVRQFLELNERHIAFADPAVADRSWPEVSIEGSVLRGVYQRRLADVEKLTAMVDAISGELLQEIWQAQTPLWRKVLGLKHPAQGPD